MACLQIYRELLSLATFLRVHSNSKEVSYLYWQNRYPNLKTTCHIELKVFLWTKPLESLLLAKYLISVAANLMISATWSLSSLCLFSIPQLSELLAESFQSQLPKPRENLSLSSTFAHFKPQPLATGVGYKENHILP